MANFSRSAATLCEPIDIVCARCSHPFFTELVDYTLGPPPTAPPRVPHAHALTRTPPDSWLSRRGAICNGCNVPIGDRTSYVCVPCAFALCDSCARPPQHITACVRTSRSALVGALRAGTHASTWNCAACARPPESAAKWTVDSGSGMVPMSGASLTIAIGDSEARIISSAPTLQLPVERYLVRANDAAASPPVPGFMGMASFRGIASPPSTVPSSSWLRSSDLSFSLLCDKKLGDLEDLGHGRHNCADCKHTVTAVETWGEYAAMARAGRCVAARIIDPENAHLVPVAAVRGRA